jgi:hypothetical protein
MQVTAFGLLAAVVVAAFPRVAVAEDSGRTVTASVVSGARFFNKDLDLNTDVSFGARVGMGLSPRWGLLFDFLASHPTRKTSGEVAPIDAMRTLARANILTGRVRPYLMAGLGGILFFFNDAPNGAEGAITFGAGADYRFGTRTLLFLEGSSDVYRSYSIVYDPNGRVVSVGPRETQLLGAASVGIGVEF